MPDNMSMSPEVQAFGQGSPGPDQTEDLFKQRFNEMAYSVLYSKFADIAAQVVTFKILEVDADEGKGVGVFIVNYNEKPIYIPVILTDSQLKPLEMFYCKSQNIFLPLTTEWLDEVSKMALDEMGDGAQMPKEVPQDVNIKDLIVPPTTQTGRFGFASAEDMWELDSKRLFKEAEFQPPASNQQEFLGFMQNYAPKAVLDGVKLAFERNPNLLQKFASNYGVNALTSAMSNGYARANSQEKTAAAPEGRVVVLTKTASEQQLRDVFGRRTSQAYSSIMKEGFAVHDSRHHIEKVAVKIEGPSFLASPGPESGWFRLYFADGAPETYFVIPFPMNESGGCEAVSCGHRDGQRRVNIKHLVVSKDGKDAWTADDIMGEKIFATSEDLKNSKIGKIVNQKGSGDTPTAGSYGFFINSSPSGMECTVPIRVEQVVTDGGIKKIICKYGDGTFIVDGNPSRKRFDKTMKGSMIFLPNSTKFIKLLQEGNSEDSYDKIRAYERKQKNSVIKDPQVLLRWMGNILAQKGATPMKVKSAGLNQWWVGKADMSLSLGPALEKVANMYSIGIDDAVGVLIDAQKYGSAHSYILDKESGTQVKIAFEKLAQQPMPQEQPMQYQSAPGQQQGLPPVGDPNAMSPMQGQEMQPGEDPMQMAPQPPPPMSPTDLALGEAIDGLTQQNEMQTQQNQSQMQQLQQQMEMQAQSNQQLVGTLQGIQQRATQISQATGGMIPPGAEQSPAAAAQALAPVPPEEPPPPPMAMMDNESGAPSSNPETIAQQVNPEMVENVEQFQDQGMFDTAAIAMLAAAPVLQDIVSSYVPNLEKAVDNLGRVLLTLWMKEKETKEAVGDEQFISLEEKLRTVFKNMGDVVLALSHNAVNAQQEADRAQEMMQTSQR